MNFKRYHVSRNLFDYTSLTTQQGAYIDDNGDLVTTGATAGVAIIYWSWIPVSELTEYCMSCATSRPWTRVYFYDSNKNFLSRSSANNTNDTAKSFTTPTNCAYVNFQEWTGNNPSNELNTVMLNTGSTPLPYEPYSSEVWHDIPNYIHNTSTDTITALPADIYPNAATATVGLKGNMSQTGTPTPDNPIIPQETGEKTGNLFDDDNAEFGKWVNSNGSIATNATYAAGYDIKVGTVSEFAVKYYGDKPYSYSMAFYDSNDNFLSRVHWSNPSASYNTFSVPENAVSARFQVAVNTSVVMTREILKAMKLMLNTGSTALPYEPYGYKLDISSASTTTPVYLGEIESTRRIKKLVLTGEETYRKQGSSSTASLYAFTVPEDTVSRDNVICSHLPFSYNYSTEISICFYSDRRNLFLNFGLDVMNAQSSGNTVAGLKEYLAAQYAAGTPVTVWYVLATPETAVVNEPLRKIGEYADEVSGISIPVTAGGDTISVDTTLQPSEVTVNYKGWHPAIVHERTNGAWT